MIHVPRLHPERQATDADLPGSNMGWWIWGTVVLFRCPNAHTCWLPHAIAADGVVCPSAVCPVKPCEFHEFLTLDDWTEGEREKQPKDACAMQKAADVWGVKPRTTPS